MPITITHQQMNEYQAGQNEEVDLQRAIAESKEEANNVPLTHEDYGGYTIVSKQNIQNNELDNKNKFKYIQCNFRRNNNE